MRAPVRSFVAGASVVALAMLAAGFLAWNLARDTAPSPMDSGLGLPSASFPDLPPTQPVVYVPILVTPTSTPTPTPGPTWTPDTRRPTQTPTQEPLPCTATAEPGVTCDVAPWPAQAAIGPTATVVLCDVVLRTPDPYHNMPGRYCQWATTTATPTAQSAGSPDSGR